VNEADELNEETEGERSERVGRFWGTSHTESEGDRQRPGPHALDGNEWIELGVDGTQEKSP
jgi:hypothetical protein